MGMVQLFLPQFREAAADGSVLELKLRMLCGVVPALTDFGYDRLEDAECAVIDYFASDLTPEDKELLTTARQLRNKVLHCDFHAARAKLRAAGEDAGSADVKMSKVDLEHPDGIQPAIDQAMKDMVSVSGTSSTREGTVFGWFLELGASGDLQRAAGVFQRATAIVDRLSVLHAEREAAAIIAARP